MKTLSTAQSVAKEGCQLAIDANDVKTTKPMWHMSYNKFDSINEGSGG